jgi:hypothetical protein
VIGNYKTSEIETFSDTWARVPDAISLSEVSYLHIAFRNSHPRGIRSRGAGNKEVYHSSYCTYVARRMERE